MKKIGLWTAVRFDASAGRREKTATINVSNEISRAAIQDPDKFQELHVLLLVLF